MMTTTEILTGIKNWVTGKLTLKQDVISDLASIRSGAQAGSTAVQPADIVSYFDDASYDSATHRINFYHGQTVKAYIDASPFIVDGMVDDVRIENGYLVIDFNTASGKQDISIPLTDIFNPNNYYTKTETDVLLSQKQGTISDLSDIRSGSQLGSTAYQKPSNGIPKTDMTADVQSSLNKAETALQEHQDISGKADKADTYTKEQVDQLQEQQNEEIQESLDEKANIDGYYETLGAGTATNLKGDSIKQDTFAYRPTAGSLDVESGAVPDGGAYLENIKGNTVAWNQLNYNRYRPRQTNGVIKEGNLYKLKVITAGYNNSFTLQRSFTDHIYYVGINVNEMNYSVRFGWSQSQTMATNNSTQAINLILGKNSGITRPGEGYSFMGICTTSSTQRVGETIIAFKDFEVIDLTLIYGTDKEPSSVAQFEADYEKWFGRPIGAEPYDKGSLIPVTMSALKTVGFNQYNPTTGLVKAIIGKEYQITGTYTKLWESEESSITFTEYTYGDAVSNDTYYSNNNNHYISSKDVEAYDNTQTYVRYSYCVYNNSVYKSNVAIATAEDFDSTKWDLIADVAAMVTEGIFVPMDITPDSSGKFTPTKYYLHVEGGNNSDTCVHLVHSGAHDGEYEPYWESQVNVPITQLTGKLNGTGESVVVFPDGMKRAGNAFDEIKVEGGVVKAIVRVQSVDIGSMTITRPGIFFSVTIPRNVLQRGTALNTRYKNAYVTNNATGDKLIGTNERTRLRIIDKEYSTLMEFKEAMQGFIVYYVLETPQVYILDNFKLPLVYNVDDYGTEEVVNAENTHGVAPTLGIRYGLNTADFVRNSPKNFITKESMEKFLDRLGTAMNGVWSMTWDASNNMYDYSFEPNAQSDTQDGDNVEPDEEEPIEEEPIEEGA